MGISASNSSVVLLTRNERDVIVFDQAEFQAPGQKKRALQRVPKDFELETQSGEFVGLRPRLKNENGR